MVKTSPLPESNVIQDFPCNLQPRILQDPKLQAPRSFISNWVIVLNSQNCHYLNMGTLGYKDTHAVDYGSEGPSTCK